MSARRYRWQIRVFFVLMGLAAVGGSLALRRHPDLADRVQTESGGLVAALSRWTGTVPLAIAEILLGLFILRQVFGALIGLVRMRRHGTRLTRTLGRGVLGLAAESGFLVLLFYGMWGLNYSRAKLADRLGWDGPGASLAEVEDLAAELIRETNTAYLVLHSTDDVGRPTTDSRGPHQLFPFLAEGFARIHTQFGEPSGIRREFGPPKSLKMAPILQYLGLSGFYFPWTAEACVNAEVPACELPLVVAHEMAHQRGFAPEDEANFIGYLACRYSSEPLMRYSASLFAQKQLLVLLASVDRSKAEKLIQDRLDGVSRDLADQQAYWTRFQREGNQMMRKINRIAQGVAESVNDAYLKSQQVAEGISNYNQCVQLLIDYRREAKVLRRPSAD